MLSIPADLARRALESAPDATLFIDSFGCVRYANRQACVLFGYALDEIMGRSIEQLMTEGQAAPVAN
jgi:PAS domain S-box-containing protein